MGPGQYPRYTDACEGRPWVAEKQPGSLQGEDVHSSANEDQAVPSVMKLIEKLTDEEVDEMILETVEVVTALHGSESQNEPSHRSSTCRHTQWWRRSSKTLSPPQQVANAQDAKIVSRQDPPVNQ